MSVVTVFVRVTELFLKKSMAPPYSGPILGEGGGLVCMIFKASVSLFKGRPEEQKGHRHTRVTLCCSLRLLSTESCVLVHFSLTKGNICKCLSPLRGTGSQINTTPLSVTMQQLYPKLWHPGVTPTEVKGLPEILLICNVSVVLAMMISENEQAPWSPLLVFVPGRPHHYLVYTPHG